MRFRSAIRKLPPYVLGGLCGLLTYGAILLVVSLTVDDLMDEPSEVLISVALLFPVLWTGNLLDAPLNSLNASESAVNFVQQVSSLGIPAIVFGLAGALVGASIRRFGRLPGLALATILLSAYLCIGSILAFAALATILSATMG